MPHRVDARRAREQWREIDGVQARHPEIRLLKPADELLEALEK